MKRRVDYLKTLKDWEGRFRISEGGLKENGGSPPCPALSNDRVLIVIVVQTDEGGLVAILLRKYETSRSFIHLNKSSL
jgi:hypothetical protein